MRTTSQKLFDRMQKIMKWTCRAEEAASREEAQKALRKVAKHSRKLARLQGRLYIEHINKEEQ